MLGKFEIEKKAENQKKKERLIKDWKSFNKKGMSTKWHIQSQINENREKIEIKKVKKVCY